MKAECHFLPVGALETGNDVTSRKSDNGFVLVFRRHLPVYFQSLRSYKSFSVHGSKRLNANFGK
jgi:hypothetical protein